MTATDGEKEQRLRDIARRIREIQAERAVLEEQWKGQPPLDASLALAALADELAALRRERDTLQAPEFTPAMAKESIDRFWDMVSDLETQVSRLDKRMDTLTARVDELDKRLSSQLDMVDTRQQALDVRLTTWFTNDALDRARGRYSAWIYRLVLLGLVGYDVWMRTHSL